jgi:hypothetical protein
MRYLEIPKFPVLRGEKAVKALYDFISELEAREAKELTEKQTTVLINLAKQLISSIEAEKLATNSYKDIKRNVLQRLRIRFFNLP